MSGCACSAKLAVLELAIENAELRQTLAEVQD